MIRVRLRTESLGIPRSPSIVGVQIVSQFALHFLFVVVDPQRKFLANLSISFKVLGCNLINCITWICKLERVDLISIILPVKFRDLFSHEFNLDAIFSNKN